MIGTHIVLDEEDVNRYLKKHGLEHGFVPLEAVLLQIAGTEEGRPCAMLVAEVDGKKVLIKASLRILMAASSTLNARADTLLGPDWRGP